MQNVRAAGSGAVAPKDLSAAWKDLLSSCIQDLVLRQNFRVGGRGLVDHRGQAHRIGLLSTPHGSALSHNGATQVDINRLHVEHGMAQHCPL